MATSVLAGFYLTSLAFDLYYNLISLRLRQTELSHIPSKLLILSYLALLATESVVSAITIWLTPKNNIGLPPAKWTFFCQIFLAVLIFVICIASIILICLKKLSIMLTGISIMIIISLVSLLWMTSYCRIFSEECSEYSKALVEVHPIHKDQSPNDSQENLGRPEKRPRCTEKIIQWCKSDYWKIITSIFGIIFTVYQLILLYGTLEEFVLPNNDESPCGGFEIAGLSCLHIGICFFF